MDPGSRPAGIAANNALLAVMRNGPNEQWYGFSDQIILYFADGLTTLPMRMQISGATFALDSEIIVSNLQRFVGSFSKLRKARINLVMSVRPSA